MTARIVVLLPDKFTVYVPISLDISAICPALSRSHLDTYRQSVNDKLNARIDEEVGVDDGRFLALIDGHWYPARAIEATVGRL